MDNNREQWGSKLGFTLASVGAVIGIGAIWKMPYIAAKTGGGAFFIAFFILTFVIVLPILIGEYIIGRSSKGDAIKAYKVLSPQTHWNWVGKLGVLGSSLVLAIYGIVGGWTLAYIVKVLTGSVSHIDKAQLSLQFSLTTANTAIAITGTGIFILLNILIVSQGVRAGLETVSKIVVPMLFILLIILTIRGLTLPNALSGLGHFLKPDFSAINSETLLLILGQSFFSLSVGISLMVTYGSYLNHTINIPKTSSIIVLLNFFLSILVALAIFPALLSFGLSPDEGPGILFVVLPSIFNQLPFGTTWFVAFLVMFFVAILSSSFSLLETATAPFINRFKSRPLATWVVGGVIFLVAIPATLSFGIWSDITIFGQTIFRAIDYVTTNIIFPIGALFTAIFVGFKLPRQALFDEFTSSSGLGRKSFMVWLLLLKYIAPIAIILIFLSATGIISF
ncbi:sodium-dependent transporter [Listeria grandensis]|uniref:sodium-dependent transporter n=1 Tax=Listeria grandensis TaxID=1494963 RepID=UPI00164CFB5C|nr:sodium-dependent transporter [Listeria grandensis]MBC6316915.1 sodium-dependent transporter [Listeria grandensis]